MSEPVGPHAIAVVTRYIVKPGAGEAFDLLAGETAAAARQSEPGVVAFSCQRGGDPDGRIIYEMYADRSAFDAWQASAPARSFSAGARSLTVAASAENFLELEGTSSPISHQEAVTRGVQYQLRGFRERARLLAALLAAQRQLSAVVALIETSESAAAAGPALMELLGFDDEALARVVLDLQLRRLAVRERQQLATEYDVLTGQISEYESILSSRGLIEEVAGTERGEHLARLGRQADS